MQAKWGKNRKNRSRFTASACKLGFALESGAAFAAGNVYLALALGDTEVGAAGGTDKEFVVLALAVFYLSEADVAAHRAQPFQIIQVF